MPTTFFLIFNYSIGIFNEIRGTDNLYIVVPSTSQVRFVTVRIYDSMECSTSNSCLGLVYIYTIVLPVVLK